MLSSAFHKQCQCGADTSVRRRLTVQLRHTRSPRGRVGGLALATLAALFSFGCGDVYRPVAIPIPGTTPNPSALHFVYSLASDGAQNAGSISQIDVSGDAVTNMFASGLNPVHGALTPDGSRVYVANSGEDTVTSNPNSAGAQSTTIDLAKLCSTCTATPWFVHSTENGRMYVADKGDGTVSVINTSSNALIATLAVDPAFAPPQGSNLPLPNPNAQPVALAEMPNGTKIYSVNQGDSTVSAINTLDGSIAKRIPFLSPPIWAVASADNAFIYVLDTNATVSVIDTLSDTIVSSAAAGAGANFIFYDKLSSRLYLTNQNAGSVSIFDISGNTLLLHATVPIVAASSSACSAAAVSAGAAIPPAIPTAITILGDDSRAYVASYQSYTAAGVTSVCSQVDIIDNGTGLVTKTIPLFQATDNSSQTGCSSARFRVFVASSGGGAGSPFKVFISQCDAGIIADIYTFAVSTGTDQHPADIFGAALPAPVGSANSTQVNISAVSQSGNSTTYTYTTLTGPGLQVGNAIVITGIADDPTQPGKSDNGVFLISGIPSAGTFTVNNASALTSPPPSAGQNGNGTALAIGNPVFLVPGP